VQVLIVNPWTAVCAAVLSQCMTYPSVKICPCNQFTCQTYDCCVSCNRQFGLHTPPSRTIFTTSTNYPKNGKEAVESEGWNVMVRSTSKRGYLKSFCEEIFVETFGHGRPCRERHSLHQRNCRK